jgi:long-chain acyl-CoA synthetase
VADCPTCQGFAREVGTIHSSRTLAADRALLILPLFHVNTIMLSVVAPLAAGASAMILPKFDQRSLWGSVEKARPTYFSAAPPIYEFVSALPEDVKPDTSSVRFVVCGAAPMPPSAIVDFETRYAIPLVDRYGCRSRPSRSR